MRVYKRQFKSCRAFGHQWRATTVQKVYDLDERATWFIQNLRCTCCHTEKSVHISPRGEIDSRRYHYPEGYQLKGRLEHDAKAEMRKEIVDG